MNMDTPDTQPAQRVVPPARRRDKPILSCNLCRRRKLKCDRQQPCKTCTDRGLSLSCAYTRPATANLETKPSHNVHDRIDQLERLVSSLVGQGGSGAAGLTPTDPGPLTSPASNVEEDFMDPEIAGTPDRVVLEENATSYTNSGHWTSILDGIAELREQLDAIPTTAQPRDPTQSEILGPELLFGRQRHATQNELLAALPSRVEADRLLNTYFESMDLVAAFVHKPTLLHEYDQFWLKPFETPIMWLGLLFSIFCCATRFQHVIENGGDGNCDPALTALCSARMDYYRTKVVQAMVLANYSRCPPYTVETCVQYFVTEYFRSQDTQFGTSLVVGILIRIALRTGYHRDGSHFANISPFEAEMRRRVWSMIVQLDLMTSSQLGLPRTIHKSMYDTQLPRNLLEEDLNENMVELPPARPDTVSTAMLYNLSRIQVLEVFAQVVDLTNSSKQPAYRDIMAANASLKAVFESLPQCMKAIRRKDFEGASVASDGAMRRLYLGLNFLKAEVMLHRPYLLLARTDSKYEYSRMVCLDAALEILEFQKLLEQETHPGGKLWSHKWRLWSLSWKLSSLVNHDFLLATTVLALDLDKDLVHPLPVSESEASTRIRFKSGKGPSRAEIIEALTFSYGVWTEAAEKSREAQRVAAAVKYVLGKANAGSDLPNDVITTPIMDQDAIHFAAFAQQPLMNPVHDIANPHFVPPFGSTAFDINSMDWSDLNSDLPFINFEQNLQNGYLG